MLKISVGPAPSHWGTSRLESLYGELAQSPVDYVCLGETACSRRSCFSLDFLRRMCDELKRAGKEVYASSLMLVRGEGQYCAFYKLAQQVGRVEINNPAFMSLAKDYPAVTGAFINVYNPATARILAQHMIKRIVLPCELNLQSVTSIAKKSEVATEVIAHGQIPTGISHTCHTVLALGHNGKGCEHLCRKYPEGMVLEADGKPVFRVEGPMTLSASTYCLVEYLPLLEQAGVDTVRILPQWNHTGRIVRIYRDVLDNRKQPRDALEELKELCPGGLSNGWLVEKAGWVYESPN